MAKLLAELSWKPFSNTNWSELCGQASETGRFIFFRGFSLLKSSKAAATQLQTTYGYSSTYRRFCENSNWKLTVERNKSPIALREIVQAINKRIIKKTCLIRYRRHLISRECVLFELTTPPYWMERVIGSQLDHLQLRDAYLRGRTSSFKLLWCPILAMLGSPLPMTTYGRE